MIDIDLLPNAALFNHLSAEDNFRQLQRMCVCNKLLVVVPAMQFFRQKDTDTSLVGTAVQVVQQSKAQIKEIFDTKVLVPFHFTFYSRGHRATNYSRWFAAEEYYAAHHQYGYEPWFIGSKQHLPFYDTRFRGYGKPSLMKTFKYFLMRMYCLPP